MRDRTYKEVDDGDYISQKQYMAIAVSLFVTHCFFECLYIWIGCKPMVFINVASIISYIFGFYAARKGNTLTTVWIMFIEVYLHVICGCVFMGMGCGYQLWLFGSFSSIFLPFFIPDLSKSQRIQLGMFSMSIVATFVILTFLDKSGMLANRYNVSPKIANAMYYFNAIMGFGSISLYSGVYNTRMALKRNELRVAADHDYLTGIYNRQRMQKIVDAEIQRAYELEEDNLSVAIVDIDFFKKINDTYGHDIGDEALKSLTNIFKKNSATGLLYGRWGGEEFLLIAPENLSYNEFGAMLEGLRKQVEENELVIDGQKIRYTVSIGAASYVRGMTSEQLVNTADDRLYNAKESGRNRVVY